MSDRTIRIETTTDEREACGAVAFGFGVENGVIVVWEEWGFTDELYSDGVRIRIPRRIWHEAMNWFHGRD